MYLWQAPGKPVAIHLSLDVVDRLLQDVMRGFGAVPRRGAEVGGILLGRSTPGNQLLVDVEGYEPVPIEYRLGPSYLLSEPDRKVFEEAFERLRESGKQTGVGPVGFFRSQTRDAVGLVPEDLVLIDKYFPEPDKIVLLIKPFASRVSTAGFYFREEGRFQSGPPLAGFNFRRKDLGGGEPARLAPFPPATAEGATADTHKLRPLHVPQGAVSFEPSDLVTTGGGAPNLEPEPALKTRSRGGWVWLPLSLILLLLGVLLGFEAALLLRPQTLPGDPFTVGLVVTRDGDNLSVRWDRQAPAIRAATQGLLMIDDGATSLPVKLSSDQLRTGSVVYPHKTGEVVFRLDLTLGSTTVLVQKLDWKE